jgi:hypothetical protein
MAKPKSCQGIEGFMAKPKSCQGIKKQLSLSNLVDIALERNLVNTLRPCLDLHEIWMRAIQPMARH